MSERELDNWIASYMEYTENSEPPRLFHVWASIATIAAVLQRKCYLEWGTLTYFPNFYIILVAPSGKARKGTAMAPSKTLLNAIGIPLTAEAITREALIKEMKNAQNTDKDSGGNVFFHSSLTTFSEELTVFLGYNNNQLVMDLCNWFDCQSRWTYRTKNAGTDIIHGVWFNLFGATTPALLQTSLPQDAIGGGLTSRLILVYADKKEKIVTKPFLTPEQKALGVQLQNDLERIHMMSGNFIPTDSFAELWDKWYTEQHENPPFYDERLTPYLERRPTHIMKLSMIMSAARTSDMIVTDEDLSQAIAILESTEAFMPKALSGVGRSDIADILSRVASLIAYRKEMTFRDLMRRFAHDASTDIMHQVLSSLEAQGYISYNKISGRIKYLEEGEDENSNS